MYKGIIARRSNQRDGLIVSLGIQDDRLHVVQVQRRGTRHRQAARVLAGWSPCRVVGERRRAVGDNLIAAFQTNNLHQPLIGERDRLEAIHTDHTRQNALGSAIRDRVVGIRTENLQDGGGHCVQYRFQASEVHRLESRSGTVRNVTFADSWANLVQAQVNRLTANETEAVITRTTIVIESTRKIT